MHTEVDEEADKMLTAQTERDQLYSSLPAYSICQLRQAHEWLPLALSVASSKLTGRG